MKALLKSLARSGEHGQKLAHAIAESIGHVGSDAGNVLRHGGGAMGEAIKQRSPKNFGSALGHTAEGLGQGMRAGGEAIGEEAGRFGRGVGKEIKKHPYGYGGIGVGAAALGGAGAYGVHKYRNRGE